MSHPIGWILLQVASALIILANLLSLVEGGGARTLKVVLIIVAIGAGVGVEIQRRRSRKNAA